MNRDHFHGIWKQYRGKLKERWGALIDDPFAVSAGMRVRLSGQIQEQRAILKVQADRQLDDFLQRNRHWQDLSSR